MSSTAAFPVAVGRPGPDSPHPTFDVLVLAELNVDVVMKSDDEPQFGQIEQQVEDGTITLGSSGAITAVALAALGLTVTLCGMVGDDHLGRMVTTMLVEHGVDVTHVRRLPGRQTGITVVLTRSDGDRALLTYPGTMADFTVADIPAELTDACRHLHVSSIYLQTGLAVGLAALLATRRPGVTASLDPGWDPGRSWAVVRSLLPQLDWFMPNANECLAIAGTMAARALYGHVASTAGTVAPTVAGSAARLAEEGPSVVVKMGSEGALVAAATSGAVSRIRTVQRTPVDTTGAGDNFNAGFIAAMLDGGDARDFRTALAVGCACGAISTSGLGGIGRLASAQEAADLATEILHANAHDLEFR